VKQKSGVALRSKAAKFALGFKAYRYCSSPEALMFMRLHCTVAFELKLENHLMGKSVSFFGSRRVFKFF
jgi:hypothetical protein